MYSLDRADIQACHARLRGGSRTFFAASHLLPRRVRDPAAALYAFCRVADDAVDQPGGSSQTLAELRARLASIYAGQPAAAPEDRAFASVVHHFGIPRALPEALLEGFEWDIGNRGYAGIEDLQAYAARVAGTVGAMMAIIMGVRERTLIARACELGMAMQLTNIARDVGEDARAGRLYLPRDWLREVGIMPQDWLRSPTHSVALGRVIQQLLQVADGLYAQAESGIARLPLTCRVGIRSASLIYAEIGRTIEHCKLDAVSRRAVVSARRKAVLLWQAGNRQLVGKPPALTGTPAAARFLVDAVASSAAPAADVPLALPAAWWQISKRMAWTVELFARLEQREQWRRSRDLYLSPGLRSRADG